MVNGRVCRSSGHHHPHEFFVVDVSIAIDVSLSDHLVNLLISQLLSQIGHDVSELSSRDQSITITIKHLKCFDELLLSISVLHFST